MTDHQLPSGASNFLRPTRPLSPLSWPCRCIPGCNRGRRLSWTWWSVVTAYLISMIAMPWCTFGRSSWSLYVGTTSRLLASRIVRSQTTRYKATSFQRVRLLCLTFGGPLVHFMTSSGSILTCPPRRTGLACMILQSTKIPESFARSASYARAKSTPPCEILSRLSLALEEGRKSDCRLLDKHI